MSSSNDSVKLEWIRHYEGALGISAHGVGDRASVGFLSRDPGAFRTYRLMHLSPGDFGAGPDETRTGGFTLETIQYAACPPEGDTVYALTENDVYFIRQEKGEPAARSSLQTRQGELFLDLQVCGDDNRYTAAILTQDRAGTSFTVSCVEADEYYRIRPLWSKAWGDSVHCVAISCDGEYIAVGQQSGYITVVSRRRRIQWVYASSDESPVLALAVDTSGGVTALGTTGVTRHDARDGSVQWRLPLPFDPPTLHSNLPRAYIAGGAQSNFVLCGINTIEPDNTSAGLALAINGAIGDIAWDDTTTSPITGVSVSPSGGNAVISCRSGDLLMLSLTIATRPQRRAVATRGAVAQAQELFLASQQSFEDHDFAKTLKLLQEVFKLDPAVHGSGSLYDESAWQLREMVMASTKTVSPQSLVTVEAALELLPFEEKLVARRNALARLIADQISREAAACVEDGRLEDAISGYIEALSIEPGQSDLRNALRAACDQLAIMLLKQADAAFHDDRFDEAIEYLERVQDLRPNEPAVARRIEHARGLRCFATGMRHYIQRDYHEAIFWFRKALAIFPDHAEAARYLGFAENFSRQTNNAIVPAGEKTAISERFEMLE